MKTWVAVALTLVLLASLAGVGGCGANGNSAPAPPVTRDLSFPDGAPPLGQTAELICKVKAHIFDIKDKSIEIRLPEALELVSGDLSWIGNISEGEEVEVISAVVKSVKRGNWTIEVHGYINPEEHGGFGGEGWFPIYVSISEDSAEWGTVPPWYKGEPPTPTPVKVD